ncbi:MULTISPECIES: membrane protein [unclassified Prochlorococcus]|uniref:membrane protein n=1 Tax=unclassified Prochlorococcus TaxID=2627481 RepID=UPI0005339DD4|nr:MULTISPECIES: membrane protein [unclassified Prochlorococcus]KGG16246.1 putative membrane protein [Prochlorococcus sp. MIT 0603]KGG18020.1 putative membrane protein [Prochlorococcus sp. MIT 0602]
MQRKDWFGILYVSLVVIAWGTIGSLIDYPLLQKGLYDAGSLGQYLTFIISGIGSSVIAILIFKPVSKKFGGDSD